MASAKEFVQSPSIEVLETFKKRYVNADSTRVTVRGEKVNT